jgi:acyl-CoA dehydrogenase family protein 9
MRGPGMEFKEIYDTMLKPWRQDGAKALGAGLKRLSAAVTVPEVPVRNDRLKSYAGQLARLVWRFNFAVDKALIAYREPVMEMQLVQERIANAAMELFAATCVLSRWDSELTTVSRNGREATDHIAADLFVRRALRKTRQFLRSLGDNDDEAMLATADAVLGVKARAGTNGQ